MWVGVVASSAVHIQDARVQGLLVVQGKGHGIHTAPPVLSAWFLQHDIDTWMNISIDKRTTKKRICTLCTHCDILEQNPASPHVLVFQQLLGLFPLLHRALQEKTGEAWQGDIIPVEIHPLER